MRWASSSTTAGFRSIIFSCPSFCTTDCAIQFFRTPRFNHHRQGNRGGPTPLDYGVQIETLFQIGLLCGGALLHPVSVKKHLNAKQISSVPCPTCGVAPGMRCQLFSGALRRQPHVDRRFVAIEALVQEAETVHAGPSRRKPKRS